MFFTAQLHFLKFEVENGLDHFLMSMADFRDPFRYQLKMAAADDQSIDSIWI